MIADGASSFPTDVRPPITSYSPTMWNHIFTSYSSDDQVQEQYAMEMEKLKKETRSMLTDKGSQRIEKLTLIDTLVRLGIAYHFEHEIEEQLRQIHQFPSNSADEEEEDKDYDLFATALEFRLLRQHRYRVSCNVFEKFVENNKFKEAFSTDVKGLLSLYEASHVRMHGEDILEEAMNFSTHRLNDMVSQLEESPLKDKVERALRLSFHRGVSRLETRKNISIFQKDDETKNDTLLKLAKIDFNFLQNLYKKEICGLIRWWNELDLKSKLPYARDRMVESYLWGVACHFEPQYSYVREVVAKCVQLIATLDDTYDNYATLQEAELFTHTLQRWDITEIDCLPEYMRIVYKFILKVYEDYEHEAAKEEKLFAVHYAKEAVKQLGRAYNQELKWLMGRQMPTFDEYLSNGIITSCVYLIFTAIIPGMKSASEETIHWLLSEPPSTMVLADAKIARFLQDLGSHERENKKGQMLTAVDCYMKHYGVSKKEALDRFVEAVEVGWKDINTEWVTENAVPKDFLEGLLNYARSAEVTYINRQDGFTTPDKFFAPYIVDLFLDPLIV